jgi:hypothetical protein
VNFHTESLHIKIIYDRTWIRQLRGQRFHVRSWAIHGDGVRSLYTAPNVGPKASIMGRFYQPVMDDCCDVCVIVGMSRYYSSSWFKLFHVSRIADGFGWPCISLTDEHVLNTSIDPSCWVGLAFLGHPRCPSGLGCTQCWVRLRPSPKQYILDSWYFFNWTNVDNFKKSFTKYLKVLRLNYKYIILKFHI